MTDADLHKEAFNMLCGRLLGSGMQRNVYECLLDPTWVVKVEQGEHSFQNIQEWDVWERVKDAPEYAKWFAPCYHISPCGRILLMQRVDIGFASSYPDRMPAFFTDFKRRNYGWTSTKAKSSTRVTSRLVACDYGCNLLMENGMTKRMRKVEWWD